MDFNAYLVYFQSIIEDKDNRPELYQNPEYFEYTQLNWSRMNRWLKTGKLLEQTIEKLKAIQTPQNWIVITEPWCGDASHIVPFIELMSRENPLITVSYELRDAEPFRIDDYLTNGSKSIPIVIIKDESGKDLKVWGPRPKECQEFFMSEKANGADLDALKVALQKWYNADKGTKIQQEIMSFE